MRTTMNKIAKYPHCLPFLIKHFATATTTTASSPSHTTAHTFGQDINLEWLHPRSINITHLDESDRDPFIKCRTAIFNNDYQLILPMVKDLKSCDSKVVFTCLVEALGKMGRLDEMQRVVEEWMQLGRQPTSVILQIIVDKLLERGLVEQARLWEDKLSKVIDVWVGVKNSWIDYFLKVNNLPLAKVAFDELKKGPWKPNRITYSNFYKYFMKHNDFVAAEQAKTAMIASGIPPNITFYNMQLSIFFLKMMLKEVDQVIEEMKCKNIWMELSTFDILVAGYAMTGQKELMEKWLWERSKENKSKMSQRSYSRLMEQLGANMSAEQCKDFFAEIQSGVLADASSTNCTFNVFVYYALASAFLEQKRYDEVIELFHEIQRMDLVMPETFYVRLAKKCIADRFIYGLWFIKDEIGRHGITKGPRYYSLMLQFHLKKHMYDKVDELLKEMFAVGVYLTDDILYDLISHLCEKAHYVKTREILEWLGDATQPHYLSLSPHIQECLHRALFIYTNANLGGFLRRVTRIVDRDTDNSLNLHYSAGPSNLKNIEACFREAFPNVPFRLSVHVFNDLLVQCLRSKRFDDVLQVYSEMRRQSISPNQFTFTYMIKARLYLGQPEEGRKLLYEMKRFGLRPSMFQFGIVHHAHCRLGMTEEAEKLLKEMTVTFHVFPNHVFYASLLYAHCRRFEYTAVFRTFEAMERSGLKPDCETSNYVLLSLFDVGEYAEALQFFNRMCAGGVKRNTYSYTILADRMLARDDVDGLGNILKTDPMLDGNIIDAFPFIRILSYLHGRTQHDLMEQFVDLIIELGILLDPSISSMVLFILNRKLAKLEAGEARDALPARQIIEKCLIDLDEGKALEQNVLKESIGRLVSYYQVNDLHSELNSFTLFHDKLSEVRRLYHESPEHVTFKKTSTGSLSSIASVDSEKEGDVDESSSIADLLSRTRQSIPRNDLFK